MLHPRGYCTVLTRYQLRRPLSLWSDHHGIFITDTCNNIRRHRHILENNSNALTYVLLKGRGMCQIPAPLCTPLSESGSTCRPSTSRCQAARTPHSWFHFQGTVLVNLISEEIARKRVESNSWGYPAQFQSSNAMDTNSLATTNQLPSEASLLYCCVSFPPSNPIPSPSPSPVHRVPHILLPCFC